MKNKGFVTYDIACRLKEIGFTDECLGQYITEHAWIMDLSEGSFYMVKSINTKLEKMHCSAPTWEDTKEWFIEKYDLYIDIRKTPNKEYIVFVEDYIWVTPKRDIKRYSDYKEARTDAYLKAIQIVTNR